MCVSEIRVEQIRVNQGLGVHTWLRYENESIFIEKKLNHRNHGQVTHNAKKSADNSAKNTRNSPKFIRPICPIGLKIWDIIEKKSLIGRP